MAENKTKPTKGSVTAFLNKIKDKQVRGDCFAILEMMHTVTHYEPIMWGAAIIGFGKYHYVYESGREGDWLLMGFSPRKQNISLYLTGGLDALAADLQKLGKYQRGKGCLYVKSLRDVHADVLKRMLAKSLKAAQGKQSR